MKTVFMGIAAALVMAGANAQLFSEIGYTSSTLKGSGGDEPFKSSPSAIRGILGYEINSNLAIEGMLASGLSGSSVKVNGQTVAGEKMKIGNSIGLYVKPKIKLTDQVEVFARAGVVKTRIAASFVDNDVRVKETSSDSGASFGAGISYSINPKASLNADYMQYYSKEGVKIRGLTLGVGLKF